MFSNKNNFYIFKENFKKVVDNDNQININKFIYLMELMASIIFPGEQNPILAIVNSYLSERHIVIEERTIKPRSMIWDEHNKRLLETETIQAFIDFEKDLKAAFTCYFEENFKTRKIFLTWRELSLQNRRLSLVNLTRLLRDAEVILGYINVHQFTEIASKIVTPINPKENGFYNDKSLTIAYESDRDNSDKCDQMDGDPGSFFHEFSEFCFC